MEKFHNEYYRQLAEIKSALASAITAENAITLCRQLQRDCITLPSKERAKAWDRFFRMLKLLGLNSVNPDYAKVDELKVFRASPPPMVEKIMRKEPAAATSISPNLTPEQDG